MTSHNHLNDVALPHAGRLAYFHPHSPSLHTQDNNPVPPAYDDCSASQSTLVLDDSENKDTDEESNCGFWGERDSFTGRRGALGLGTVRRDHGGFYAFCCFWCAVSVCILGVLGMYFALDVVLTQFGMGTGWAMWMVRESPSQASAHYEVRFDMPTYIGERLADSVSFSDVFLPCFTESPSPWSSDMALHSTRQCRELYDGGGHSIRRIDRAMEIASR
jgi:hypothetical protein